MDRANKAMRQRFMRVQQNLGLSEKRDELQQVQAVDQRNLRTIGAIATFRKNLATCLKTCSKEDDKKKKKLDEYGLVTELGTDASQMDPASCVTKVMKKISDTVNKTMDAKIHLEQKLEKNVMEKLSKYVELDKSLAKLKEKLAHLTIDVDLAEKSLNNTKHGEEEKLKELQENLDSSKMKLETHKDLTIIEMYSLFSKEKEIAASFANFVEEQIEYHHSALLLYQNALPEILLDIENAHPSPVFGVDLEDHLKRTNRDIALVIEECCAMIRHNPEKEKGMFRVNGNVNRIKRMKAAFDASQYHTNWEEYSRDQHAVCSVLKCYLRELPEPLLTRDLVNAWTNAASLHGSARVNALQKVIHGMPAANRNNLTYLMNFLSEMLTYEDVTMMNSGNMAIVFAPNLFVGTSIENDVASRQIVEALLENAGQLFGSAHAADIHVPVDVDPYQHRQYDYPSLPKTGLSNSPASSTSYASISSENSLVNRSLPSPVQQYDHGNALAVDTMGNKNRQSDHPSPSFAVSPSPGRSSSVRPKQPAPLPPPANTKQSASSAIRSDLESIFSPPPVQPTPPARRNSTKNKQERTHVVPNMEKVSASFTVPHYPLEIVNESMQMTSPYDNVPSRDLDLTSLDLFEKELTGSFYDSKKLASQESLNSMNAYSSETETKKMPENLVYSKVLEPTLQSRPSISSRPLSYHGAIQGTSTTQQVPVKGRFPVVDVSGAKEKPAENSSNVSVPHRAPILHDAENRTLITLESTPEHGQRPVSTLERTNRVKPPLPAKPKPDEHTKL
ncbi:unnamed protein product, partial [Mesorhabditis spiculigera]